MMDGTVTVFGKLLQHMPHACLSPDDRIPWNPQPLSEGVCCLETNAVDIQSKAIGILPHPGNSLVAIGLVNPDSPCGPDAMRVQKDHDLPDDFLGFPGFDHPLFPFRTDTVKVCEAFRRLLNDIKHLLAKRL